MEIILFVLLLCLPSFVSAQIVGPIDNGALSKTASDSAYVNVTGDTMTGPLTLSGSSLTVTGNMQVWASSFTVASGGIGIGTSNPAANLEISGGNEPLNGGYTHEGNLFVRSSNNQAANTGGSIGLGGVYQGTGLAVAFGKIHGKKENATSGALGGYLAFETANNTTSPFSAEQMRITSTGNVGIGTTAPQQKLSVSSGTIHMAGTGTPATGGALCLTASGIMGKCTSAVDASGDCTCTAP